MGTMAEFSKCEVAGKVARVIDVRRKLEILFGSRLHIDGAEHKHLIRRARFHYFRNRSSVSDRCDLVFFQSNVVAKEFEWLGVLRIGGGKVDKGKQKQGEGQTRGSESN